MDRRRCLALLPLALAVAVCRLAAAVTVPERSCAAFGRDGQWATAVIDSGILALEAHAPGTSARVQDLRLNGNPQYCRIFFSADGDYVAVGINLSSSDQDLLQVGVFDWGKGNWASNFTVNQQDDLHSKLRLEGFLQKTSRLVVSGIAKRKPLEDAEVKVLLFDPNGQEVPDGVFRRTLPRSNGSWDADPVDARNDRLWFVGSPRFCPVKSVSLTGPVRQGPSIPEDAIGGIACLPDLIGFPQENVIVGANTGNENWVWRIDLVSGRGEKLVLPRTQPSPAVRWLSYSMSHYADISPDGQVLVVPRLATASDAFDRSHEAGGELDVVQVKPLVLLGVIHLKAGCMFGGVGIDHRDGSTTVLQRRCGKWERDEIHNSAR